MRGAPEPAGNAIAKAGIIPADAGSTVNNDQGRVADQDHPRGCGEHSPSASALCMIWGSSPRMRGAQLAHLFHPE